MPLSEVSKTRVIVSTTCILSLYTVSVERYVRGPQRKGVAQGHPAQQSGPGHFPKQTGCLSVLRRLKHAHACLFARTAKFLHSDRNAAGFNCTKRLLCLIHMLMLVCARLASTAGPTSGGELAKVVVHCVRWLPQNACHARPGIARHVPHRESGRDPHRHIR